MNFSAHGITFTRPLSIFLHYLQFCYDQIGKEKSAGEASKSRVALSDPDDTHAQSHWGYYSQKSHLDLKTRIDVDNFIQEKEALQTLFSLKEF